MAGWTNLLRRNAARPAAESVARVKRGALPILDPPPGTALTVNEIACLDPACPGVETVILVMEPGRKTSTHKMRQGARRGDGPRCPRRSRLKIGPCRMALAPGSAGVTLGYHPQSHEPGT